MCVQGGFTNLRSHHFVFPLRNDKPKKDYSGDYFGHGYYHNPKKILLLQPDCFYYLSLLFLQRGVTGTLVPPKYAPVLCWGW